MAALRATITSDRRNSTTSRLASKTIGTGASTWKTFVQVNLYADGHGEISVKQNDKIIHTFTIPSEK